MSTDPIASVSASIAAESDPSQGYVSDFDAWFWLIVISVVLLVVVTGVVGWFWWKKKRTKDPLSPPPDTGPNPLGDWVAFVMGLPPGLRRVLSQFQAVFVLGDTASEKTEFVRQFSGVARRERQYGKRVSYQGEALNIYLGDRCIVIVPTDSFVESESARTHARWKSVIRSVCKRHGPRVVACLAPSTTATESGMLAWARMIRAHADIISSIQEQPTPLSVVIAQRIGESTSATKRDVSPTDCLFELLVSLRAVDGGPDLTRIGMGEAVTRAWMGNGDQRRAAAKRWLNISLATCLDEWPVLFAQPGVDPVHILGLAGFFKEYDAYTGNLGSGLAELFYEEDVHAGALTAESVYFLPWHDQQFAGEVLEFQGAPAQQGVQWHPSALLRYRLIAATMFMVGALGVTAYFIYEHNQWFIAVRHLRDYDAGENVIDLSAVRDYTLRQSRRFGFYDRMQVRQAAVSRVREYLATRIVKQSDRCAPEELLSLVSLYAVGGADDCVGSIDEEHRAHRDLKLMIEGNLDDWSYHTGLKGGEVQAFLDMSCPTSNVPAAECSSDKRAVAALPDLDRVVRSLTSLAGKCELDSLDEPVISALKQDLAALDAARGPGEEVLHTLEWMRNVQRDNLKPTFDRWVSRFYPHRKRFEQLSRIHRSNEPLREVKRILGPYLEVEEGKTKNRVALTDYVVQRDASKPDVTEGTWIRLEGASLDVARVRAALQRRSLSALERAFERSMYEGSPFFSSAEFERRFRWTSRRSGDAGMSFQQEVPEVFTVASFERAVRTPLNHWAASIGRSACGGSPQVNVNIQRELEDQLRLYLNDYVSEWTRVYRSFEVRESGIREALQVLSRTDSPLRVLLQELTRQNSLTVDESFPFQALVDDALAPLEGLKAAAAAKAQDDYAGIIVALSSELEAPTPTPTFGVDYEAALQDFAKRLTGYGRVALLSRVSPASSYPAQINAWADGVKLRPDLRGPILSAVNRVHQLGMAEVRNRAQEWWADNAERVSREVLERFPFQWEARERASLEDVNSWLQPTVGRLDRELKPMLTLLLQDCVGGGCSKSDATRSELLTRLEVIQRTLFTEKGEMRELQVGVSAVWQALQLSESRLRLDGEAVVFKEQGSRQFRFGVPWDKGYVSRLDVEICAPDLQGVCERQYGRIEELEPSPWGFWNLLAKAERTGNRFTWAVPTPQGKVEVTYDVCADRSACGSLLGRVFAWK